MSRHTPGPWTFRPNPCECNDCTASHWIDGPPDAPGATLGKPIAEVREYHKGESEANARLIAAAPELFEAVRALVFLVKESGFRSGLTEEAFDAALVSGIAAIEKARGGA